MRRNHEIRIRVSKEEIESIRRKAEHSCMSVSAFIRFLAIKSDIRTTLAD
jgi:predicted DNA binding CopG/RHH family protein